MKKFYPLIFLLLCLSLLTAGTTGSTENTPAGQCALWKFAVISDTQGFNNEQKNKTCINDEILNLVAADIAVQKPDIVLVSGDLVNGWFRNGGTDYPSQYRNWKSAMKPVFSAGIKVFTIRGNHDSGPERLALPPLPSNLEPPPGSLMLLEKEYRNEVNGAHIPMNGPENEKGLTYSFDHKNACFIALDQYTDGQHRINQEWLDRQLSGNTQVHLFIFGHEPAFQACHIDNLSFYPEKRDRFWDSIGASKAKIYFCGHDHFYNRALIPDSKGNAVWQIIAGTGGGKLRSWSGTYKDGDRIQCKYHNNDLHGYVLVTVDGARVKSEWRALVDVSAGRWQVLDAFSY